MPTVILTMFIRHLWHDWTGGPGVRLVPRPTSGRGGGEAYEHPDLPQRRPHRRQLHHGQRVLCEFHSVSGGCKFKKTLCTSKRSWIVKWFYTNSSMSWTSRLYTWLEKGLEGVWRKFLRGFFLNSTKELKESGVVCKHYPPVGPCQILPVHATKTAANSGYKKLATAINWLVGFLAIVKWTVVISFLQGRLG